MVKGFSKKTGDNKQLSNRVMGDKGETSFGQIKRDHRPPYRIGFQIGNKYGCGRIDY